MHRVSARWKLVAALLVILVVALMPRRPHALYWIPAVFLLVLWPLSRMPAGYALKRILFAEFFILGITLLTLLAPGSAPVFLATLIKSNLCIFVTVLLAWTTPFHEIVHELRRLRFPAVMLTTLALMYRYLPVLAEESGRMQRARASRAFTCGRALDWRSLAAVLGRLFIRSVDRAERIYLAMCARGWK